jgi:ketosteroid isomerase-like protein
MVRLFLILGLIAATVAWGDVITPTSCVTTAAECKELIATFYDAIERGDEAALQACLGEECSIRDLSSPYAHSRFALGTTPAKHLTLLHAAFPSLSIRHIYCCVEGNCVSSLVHIQGIHKGPFLGIERTNRPVSIRLCAFFTIEEGRIVAIDEMWNERSVMKQIGYMAL